MPGASWFENLNRDPECRSNAVARAGKIACRLCLFCLGFVSIKWEKVAAPDARSAIVTKLFLDGSAIKHKTLKKGPYVVE